MTGPYPSLRWRIFAVFMVVSILPYETASLLGALSAYDAARYVVDSIAMVGLVGYAFNRQIGARPFWRMFTPVFIIFSMTILFIGMIPVVGIVGNLRPVPLGALLAFLLLAVTMIWTMSLALLRYGGWRNDGRFADLGAT